MFLLCKNRALIIFVSHKHVVKVAYLTNILFKYEVPAPGKVCYNGEGKTVNPKNIYNGEKQSGRDIVAH